MPTLTQILGLNEDDNLELFKQVLDAFDKYMKPRYGEFWMLESHRRFRPSPNKAIAEDLNLPLSYVRFVRKVMIRAAKENLAELESQHESS
jgi:hypothetical protein